MTLDEIEARLALLALTPIPSTLPQENAFFCEQKAILEELFVQDPARAIRVLIQWHERHLPIYDREYYYSLFCSYERLYSQLSIPDKPLVITLLVEYEQFFLLSTWQEALAQSLTLENSETLCQLSLCLKRAGRQIFSDFFYRSPEGFDFVAQLATMPLEIRRTLLRPCAFELCGFPGQLGKRHEAVVCILRASLDLPQKDQRAIAAKMARWVLTISKKSSAQVNKCIHKAQQSDPALAPIIAPIRLACLVQRFEQRFKQKRLSVNCRRSALRRLQNAKTWIPKVTNVYLRRALLQRQEELLQWYRIWEIEEHDKQKPLKRA